LAQGWATMGMGWAMFRLVPGARGYAATRATRVARGIAWRESLCRVRRVLQVARRRGRARGNVCQPSRQLGVTRPGVGRQETGPSSGFVFGRKRTSRPVGFALAARICLSRPRHPATSFKNPPIGMARRPDGRLRLWSRAMPPLWIVFVADTPFPRHHQDRESGATFRQAPPFA
jgi:hypothetical protein